MKLRRVYWAPNAANSQRAGKSVYGPDARWRFCDQKYKLPKFWISHIKIVQSRLILAPFHLAVSVYYAQNTALLFGGKTAQNGGVVVEPEALQWPKFKH